MLERTWLNAYPAGVAADIDSATLPPSLAHLIEDSCQRHRHRPAFTCLGATIRYSDVDRASAALAYWLQQQGLQPGERVAIVLPNVLAHPIANFAVLRAGLCVVNINPLYTVDELRRVLADSGARVVIGLENLAPGLIAALQQTQVEKVVLARVADLMPAPRRWLVDAVVRYVRRAVPTFHLDGVLRLHAILRENNDQRPAKVALNHDSLAFLQYTGGTTGHAKAAELTHGNLLANLTQAGMWIAPHVHEGQEVIATALPLYHIFSLTANCLTFLRIGAHNVLIPNPRDVNAFVKALCQQRITAITGVDALYNLLMDARHFSRIDFTALRIALGGGTALRQRTSARWKTLTGVPILEAYGLTETSPAVCINPLDLPEHNGSVGLAVPSTDLMIIDTQGQHLPLGEAGEVCVRGPQVMRGYWRQEEENQRVFTEDGFFRTGDIGFLDDNGFLFLIDRIKDTIIVSGFNVFPSEVEEVACQIEGVREAAVIGVSDERSGEKVVLCLICDDPAPSREAIIAHCREHLAAYKCPHQIEFHSDLPRTPVGKVQRRQLRDQLRAQQQETSA